MTNKEFDDYYFEEVSKYYWVEEEEMKAGIHPSQILERVSEVLRESDVNGEITFMDYSQFSGTRVGVSVNGRFYGVFDYINNEFESTPNSRLNEFIEVAEMGLKTT